MSLLAIPVEVPGLETVLREVPAGSLVVLEGGPDPAKSVLARRLARSAVMKRRRVRFLTSRSAEGVVRAVFRDGRLEAPGFSSVTDWENLKEQAEAPGDLFVDSFSFLALDASDDELVKVLQHWRSRAHREQAVVVLTIEERMLGPRQEAIVKHMADGLVEFRRREREDSVRPFVQIPRWTDGSSHPTNFYLTFTGDDMMVDTRTRLV